MKRIEPIEEAYQVYKLRSVGGALVVTIPQDVVRLTKMQAGDLVRFVTNGKEIGIYPLEKRSKKR